MNAGTTVVVAETPPPVPEASVETVAEAQVEIARIEAEAAITINADNNDTAETIADITATDDEDVAWLRGELGGLRASLVTHEDTISSVSLMMASLAEQNQQQAEQMALMAEQLAALSPPENPETPPPPSPETAESEVTSASPADPPAPATEPAIRRRERRWLGHR